MKQPSRPTLRSPPRPKPRDRYFGRGTRKQTRPGTWENTIVEVFRRPGAGDEPQKVCEFERNYSLLRTFEPFRQGSREFALISPQYTGTSVLDLATGLVIAEEPDLVGRVLPCRVLRPGLVGPARRLRHSRQRCSIGAADRMNGPAASSVLSGDASGAMTVRGRSSILTRPEFNPARFGGTIGSGMWNCRQTATRVPASTRTGHFQPGGVIRHRSSRWRGGKGKRTSPSPSKCNSISTQASRRNGNV